MDVVVSDEYLLSNIFRYLSTKELVSSCGCVCKAWKKVVFNGCHRPCPPGIYSILLENVVEGENSSSLLIRYRSLCERNFLREPKWVSHHNRYSPNCFNEFQWVPTQNRFHFDTRNKDGEGWTACAAKYDQNILLGTCSSLVDERIYEVTQVLDFQQRYIERGFSPETSRKIMEFCPDLIVTWNAYHETSSPDINIKFELVVSMDDGKPVLAPYNNRSLTCYTREAVYNQTVQSVGTKRKEKHCLQQTLTGYPKFARRLIVSLRAYVQNATAQFYVPTLHVAKSTSKSESPAQELKKRKYKNPKKAFRLLPTKDFLRLLFLGVYFFLGPLLKYLSFLSDDTSVVVFYGIGLLLFLISFVL